MKLQSKAPVTAQRLKKTTIPSAHPRTCSLQLLSLEISRKEGTGELSQEEEEEALGTYCLKMDSWPVRPK